MKCFILILFLSVNAFSHEPHKLVGELSIWEAEQLMEKHWDLYLKIEKEVILEFTKKGNFVAQLGAGKITPHESKHKKNSVWLTLSYIRSGMYWSLKALDTAFKKQACVGSVLDRIESYSKAFNLYKWGDNYKGEKYKSNELMILESLKNLYPYYYASSYMTAKAYVREYERYKKDDHKIIKVETDKISRLSKKKQKVVWDLVKKWEKRWGDKLYNPKHDKECEIFQREEHWEIDREVMNRLLEAIH